MIFHTWSSPLLLYPHRFEGVLLLYYTFLF